MTYLFNMHVLFVCHCQVWNEAASIAWKPDIHLVPLHIGFVSLWFVVVWIRMWFDISSWWLRNIWDQTDLCGGSNVPFQSHWTGPECLFSFWLLMECTMQQFIVNKYTCRFKRNARLKSLLLDFHGRLHLWYCSAVFLYDRDVFGRRCSLAQDRSQSPLLLESPCRIGMWMSLVAMQVLFFELQLEFLVCACRMIGLLWMTDRLDELMHELFLHEMYLQ